jgi:uncharacterized protein
MGRLVVLILLVVIAVWLVRRALRAADAGADAPRAKPAEELVRCAQCGVLLPRGEARESAGRVYCTEEHARLGPRAR